MYRITFDIGSLLSYCECANLLQGSGTFLAQRAVNIAHVEMHYNILNSNTCNTFSSETCLI